MYTIENSRLRAGFELHGAELVSLVDKKNNQELIWQADPTYWKRHAPVLFPFVGKVNGGEYRYDGKTYNMGQHGFARDMEFTLVEKDDNSITFELCSDEETLQKYPFAFKLTIRYVLEANTLTVIWNVQNPADEEMYYSIGAHPAFNVAQDKKQEYKVQLHAGESELEYILIDPETAGADYEHPHTLKLDAEHAVLATDELFANDALIFDNNQIKSASIVDPSGKKMVTVECPDFPSFGLWSQSAAAPFICLEPWIGRVDNNGFVGELPEKYGEQKLEAKQEKEYNYVIVVE